ncbi:lysozyme [Serratia marcescens]|uniref:glycoside hydrolase family 24 protein n=1 Tax=Serratia marcescens TaxID=615 RepID=UPI00114DE31C|nr:glycoside hydrolase family 104 protein [Serratia marcescens]QDI18342.1 lysozyme [Serratia marcescens]QDI28085.1 lysozyme [Serratia marcescens]QDI42549.1 lysozyme [Serratia marcescens]QDI56978.1 lysozyme [Serratia marcescens]
MAETIDSLLVSLGLETDAKSFQKANNAIKGVKDGVLQLAAAAGVGFGFKALTTDLAKSTLEMNRLSKITGFTLKQIDGLRYAMRRSGLNADSANNLVQRIPAWKQAASQGELGDKAYWSGKFNPTELIGKSNQEALEYIAESYEKMNNDQRRTLRSGLGLGENDDITRLFEGGLKGLRAAAVEFEKLYQPLPPSLIESANKFNEELATLETNFTNLQRQIGGPVLDAVNELLKATGKFMTGNKNKIAAIVGGTMDGSWYTSTMDHAEKKGKEFRNWLRDSHVVKNDAFLQKILGDKEKVSNDELPAERIIDQLLIHGGNHLAENDRILSKIIPKKNESSFFIPAPKNSTISNPNVKNYLDIIAKSEGTAGYMNNGYNTLFGGDQFSDFSDHPRILKEFTETNGKKNKTSAAGRYQFTQKSWDEAAAALGLTDFSPDSQDMAALYLIQRAGQLDNVVNGNFEGATAGLGGVWASLPSSTYAQPKHSYDAMQGFYDMQNTPPAIAGRSGGSGPVTVHQENNVTIHAPGADASEIDNRLASAFTDYSRQARDMMDTEHY